jgi:hypothetical protein
MLLEGEALGALRPLHLEALATALAFDALDLEGLGATTTAAAATAHLEGLAATAATAALHIRLPAAVASATAARPGFGIVVAMSTAAAGLGRHGGRDRQRRNAGRQE